MRTCGPGSLEWPASARRRRKCSIPVAGPGSGAVAADVGRRQGHRLQRSCSCFIMQSNPQLRPPPNDRRGVPRMVVLRAHFWSRCRCLSRDAPPVPGAAPSDACEIPPAFQRRVRVYDPSGKLSRHMNPEIDEIVLKFETSLGLPPVMSLPLRMRLLQPRLSSLCDLLQSARGGPKH